MSQKIDNTLAELHDQFKSRLSNDVKVVRLRDYGLDSEEEWLFPPATGTQGDEILKFVADGKPFRARVEAIWQRARWINPNTGKQERRFGASDRAMLMKLDPEFIVQVSDAIGAFDDIEPDVESAKKT